MAVSVFDLFTVGIGPSSSHTVGPMRAARKFILHALSLEKPVHRVLSELFGSLGHTGKGHGSDVAVLLGLEGEKPNLVDTDSVPGRMKEIRTQNELNLNGQHSIHYNDKNDLIFHRKKTLPRHANGMKFTAFDVDGNVLSEKIYYSVGGGFVISDETNTQPLKDLHLKLPYDFQSGEELLNLTKTSGLSISSLMMENEKVWQEEEAINSRLDEIWSTMSGCIDKGIRTEGILPGGLKVRRRAPSLHRKLLSRGNNLDPLAAMDWVNLYALSVNEENAAGGRVVTAPTNGAAGIIPAVIKYYEHFYQPTGQENIRRFLLTSAAIGILYKLNASISGAEVGCQGEVGVACSMAAAGLTEALGGSPAQVECAAEIGMEHNLGLTCDPVGGLVQVPCIERNAMGAVKAINAARLAMQGDGDHKVSLDKVIKTMRETGADMKTKYKETARGGLAVNIIEC
ncbi:L-serine ammonia-lyase [Aliikangiella coralliicola]|uniref:L-serine dehydratase n=1 Tax=Aliikangiella coralliicola TaxID=2592383 RepID=A0A545U508_9GAMM|nr:L-serine ammonia-lyase [Aliikangiella coralliicola]TQV84557.1 L-serine ammonia-lyase [Aliikangiella coralliicola]